MSAHWKPDKYIVVCQNKKQAKDLFKRLIKYFQASNKTFRMDEERMYISNGYESFMCVPQRKMYEIVYGRKGFECILVSWREIDYWLDKKKRK